MWSPPDWHLKQYFLLVYYHSSFSLLFCYFCYSMICWLHPPPQHLHHWLQQHLLSEIGQELPVEAQTVFSSEKHWDMEKLLGQGTEIASTWPLLLMSKHSVSWNISKPGCWRGNMLGCRRHWVTASNACAGCSIPYRELILQIRKVAFQPKQHHNYRASYKKPCPCCDSTMQLPRAWLPGLQPHPSAAPAAHRAHPVWSLSEHREIMLSGI